MASQDSRIQEIYISTLEQAPDARDAFLANACDNNAELIAKVKRLLDQDRSEVGFLGESRLADALVLHERSRIDYVGRQIGPYELIEKIGQGGMGSVFLAKRVEEFEKRVAIKLMERSWQVPDLRRRFESEIQLQAAMGRHPNIVEIIDAGETEDRVPYFVMEYVDGDPIDVYCDQNNLSIAERIALFRNVAGAVQFAHQNTVIHRDLKPSNILVTRDGVPKLIDFGIAKLMHTGIEHQDANQTQTGFRPMTPRYASPEQIRGDSLTTATDIYSLGVVLFELLTGRLPAPDSTTRPSDAVFRPTKLNNGNAEKHLAAKDLSRIRGTDVRTLKRRLAGDLDHIVMMALRQEPERRYHSADQFAEDLRRNLDRLPVAARPDSFRYRAAKFMERNRWGLLVGGIVGLSLIAGIIGTGTQWARAERNLKLSIRQEQLASEAAERESQARKRAEHSAETSDAVRDFLDTILQSARPSKHGHKATVREVVDVASQKIDQSDLPNEVKAQVCRSLGMTYRGLGSLDQSMYFFAEALEYHRDSEVRDELEELTTKDKYAGTLRSTRAVEHIKEALLLRREVYERRSILLGEENRDTIDSLNNLANIHAQLEEFAEALKLYEKALSLHKRIGSPAEFALSLRHNIAVAQIDMGKGEDVIDDLVELRKEVETEYGKETRYSGASASLARAYQSANEFGKAKEIFRELLVLRAEVYGEEHNNTVSIRRKLSRLLVKQKDYAEAMELLPDTIRINGDLFGVAGGSTFRLRQLFAQCLEAEGHLERCEEYLVETHRILKSERSPGNRYIAESADDIEAFAKRTGRLRSEKTTE